ncbi:ABC transporter substrate-binding protein [Thalassobaculum litoreum]|uniref:Trehalose/maltose transport system substrate-binding protein n=1 Tax=Thalassobaculum litoreum DSM 18839 TaxID=1123362 RepID=A0A8G2BLK8_9PROT|nr:ABC transporter substrate-binding protein [Thalassobaculum litoreum]SDG41087.1 trehalose/maltose transport system substrate-binding protein [Thalassobaculum litoreum DSM 18839]
MVRTTIARTLATLALGAGSLMGVQLAATQSASAQALSISCGAVGVELELCKAGVEAWSKDKDVEVEIVSTPNSSTERLALYQQILAAQGDDIDILQIDVVWPGVLAPHLVDMRAHNADAGTGHFEALIDNNTVDGKLLALPWWTDAGVLYYRADLLEKYGFEPPTTWAQMTDAAKTIMEKERAAGDDDLWGYVWQGKSYEGLTCDALEWVDSYGGGAIVNAEGEVTINNPKAVEALEMAASWVGDITPQGVLNYDEEASRGVFQSGNAVFMRNWPYAWALAQGDDSPIKGKVGVVALPKGGEDGGHTGTLGGWNLAVSKYSKNPDLAVDLALFLTSQAQQKQRAISSSYNPTYPELYADAAVLEANPFFGTLEETFTNAVARPSAVVGDKYNRVSSQFWSAVHGVLAGQQEAGPALAGLESSLTRLGRRGRW